MTEFCTTTDKNGRTLYWKVMKDGKRKRVSKKVAEKGDVSECLPKRAPKKKPVAPKKTTKTDEYYIVFDPLFKLEGEEVMKVLAIVKGGETMAKVYAVTPTSEVMKLKDFDTINYNNWTEGTADEVKAAFDLVNEGKWYVSPVEEEVINDPDVTKVKTKRGDYEIAYTGYEDMNSERLRELISFARGYIEYLADVSPGNLSSFIFGDCKYQGKTYVCLYRAFKLKPSAEIQQGKKPKKGNKVLRFDKDGTIYPPTGKNPVGNLKEDYEYKVNGVVKKASPKKYQLTVKDLTKPFIRDRARIAGVGRIDGHVYEEVRKSTTKFLNEMPALDLEDCEKAEKWESISETLDKHYDLISDYMCYLFKKSLEKTKKRGKVIVTGDDVRKASDDIF